MGIKTEAKGTAPLESRKKNLHSRSGNAGQAVEKVNSPLAELRNTAEFRPQSYRNAAAHFVMRRRREGAGS